MTNTPCETGHVPVPSHPVAWHLDSAWVRISRCSQKLSDRPDLRRRRWCPPVAGHRRGCETRAYFRGASHRATASDRATMRPVINRHLVKVLFISRVR